MKILVLPNAFKGSLSAVKAAQVLASTLQKKHEVRAFPVSDGGDGFIDFFKTLDPHAKTISLTAKNAFLKNKKTSFLLLSDSKTAVVETARVCGLGSTKKEELDPLNASSFGVGQALVKAARLGAKTIYVGLGGVACNDGGAGMAVACGAKLYNKNGAELPLGAEPLLRIKRVDLSALRKNFAGVKIYGVADVTNPLLGPKSSAKVFGPQKGASPEQVKLLDKAMSAWDKALTLAGEKNPASATSTAAAGAIAAGLYSCFGAQLILGSDFLFKKAGLEKYFPWADLVITTEGKLDKQTFYGKAPLAVLQLARKYKKPVLFICGKLDEKALVRQQFAPQQVAVLTDFAPDETSAQQHAEKYLKQIAETL